MPLGRVARLAVCASLLVLLSLAALPASGARPHTAQEEKPRLPTDFVGLVAEDVFAGATPYRMAELRRQKAVGSHLLRQNFDWAAIERAPDRYFWRKYDNYVLMAARFNVRILAILFNTPGWRSAAPTRNPRHGTYPPKKAEEFATFARKVVQRYGPDGYLWKQHPEIKPVPIKSWQIWNEPNLDVYWATGANAAAYVRLLRAASIAIREVDSTAEIVTAGLPQSRLPGVPLLTFLERMYKHDAQGTFNTVALNPYARSISELTARIRSVRRVMNRYGDIGARIWLTEIGWSDHGPKSPFRVGPEKQADLITRSFGLLKQKWYAWGIRGVIYAFWKDGRPYPPQFKDFWGLHTGLFDKKGKPKKAYSAFVRATRDLRRGE
jgi:polysaccharide biosynthesis protein PslG